jgi:hypothetical protein
MTIRSDLIWFRAIAYGRTIAMMAVFLSVFLSGVLGEPNLIRNTGEVKTLLFAAIDGLSDKRLGEACIRASEEIGTQLGIDLSVLTDSQRESDAVEPGGIRLAAKTAIGNVLDLEANDRLCHFPRRLHGLLYLQAMHDLGYRQVRPWIQCHTELLRKWTELIPRPPNDAFSLSTCWEKELANREIDDMDREMIPGILEQNSPGGSDRIAAGRFDLLFRGAGRYGGETRQIERWAIQTLLEDSGQFIAASLVWKYLSREKKRGYRGKEAYRRALTAAGMKELIAWEFRSGHAGKILGNTSHISNKVVANNHFVFATAAYGSAALYGPVIFAIRPEIRRGLDVASYLREKADFFRGLTTADRLSLKTIWVNLFCDRDEYLLASHIPNREIVGCDVRLDSARLPSVLSFTLRRPGPLIRRYLKRCSNNRLWLDVLDGSGARIGRLTADRVLMAKPWRMAPLPDYPLERRLPVGVFPEDLINGLTIDERPLRYFPGNSSRPRP